MGLFQRKEKQEEHQGKDRVEDPLNFAITYFCEKAGGQVCGERIALADGLQVRLELLRHEKNVAQIAFEIENAVFEEPIWDISVGVGAAESEALKRAVDAIVVTCVAAIQRSLARESMLSFTTDFFGTEKVWDVSAGDIAVMGKAFQAPPQGFWELLAQELPAHLGNRKRYLVKVYASKSKTGETICECCVNGVVSTGLTEKVSRWAAGLRAGKEPLLSGKQYFLVTQRTEKAAPYPYTREQIFQFTDQAIGMFAACIERPEKSETLAQDLAAMTGDANLAVELESFLPDLCARMFFPEAHYAEKISVLWDGQKDNSEDVYLDRFTSYRWMEQRLHNRAATMREPYTAENLKRLVAVSAVYNAIASSAADGSKLEDLFIFTAMPVPASYAVQ